MIPKQNDIVIWCSPQPVHSYLRDWGIVRYISTKRQIAWVRFLKGHFEFAWPVFNPDHTLNWKIHRRSMIISEYCKQPDTVPFHQLKIIGTIQDLEDLKDLLKR